MGTFPHAAPRVGILGCLAALVVFACLIGVGANTADAQELFVTNRSANSVTVYPRTAFGNLGPLRTIFGISTGLNGPMGVAQDVVHGELFVANNFGVSISVYPLGANGNVAPLRTISGLTFNPIGLAVDLVHDELFVVGAGTVRVYSRTASGDVPLRTVLGPFTQLNQASGIALDLIHDEMVIANAAGNIITTFPRTANGNVTPLRVIQGPNTGLNFVNGVALDLVNDEIFALSRSSSAVTVYPRTATGNVSPSRIIQGNNTGLNLPAGISLDLVDDELVVANTVGGLGQGSVTVYRRGASGNTFPLRTLFGQPTGLNFPDGVTLAAIPPLSAAVLPLSRSHQIGTFLTAFATIINSASFPAQQCFVALPANAPLGLGPFVIQTTDPTTNALTGTPNTPANIAGGEALQTFVFGFTPTAVIPETSLAMNFLCDNTVPAPFVAGVSELTLVTAATPVPDTIALIATVSGDGVVRIASASNTQVFAVGTSNVGAAGTIVVSADTGGTVLPVTLTVCETNSVGACLAPPASSVTVSYAAGSARSFGFFAAAHGSIVFDPAVNRVFVRLKESATLRGATSAAICTQPNTGC
jgi:hypothetical protein